MKILYALRNLIINQSGNTSDEAKVYSVRNSAGDRVVDANKTGISNG